MELVSLWKECGKCAGFCIGVGKKFFSEGVKEVDEETVPAFEEFSGNVTPRVILSYAILHWFTVQVWYACYSYKLSFLHQQCIIF